MTRPTETSTILSTARNRAATFETTIDQKKRKRLGQFFTGLPLSRILAALSTGQSFQTILDPMAGHADLLDAAIERSLRNKNQLTRVDAIEIDTEAARACHERLTAWKQCYPRIEINVYEGSAFKPDLIDKLPKEGYDLVITNPPYVRYQTISENSREKNKESVEQIRQHLLEIATARTSPKERKIWEGLIAGFSGLSDLSVPAWLLSAMLVRPGHTLALVAPATWQSRDYADVLQYLLTRCFQIQTIIADRQPGWFSKALVRTNLITAIRLSTSKIQTPLCSRTKTEHRVIWSEIDKIAKQGESLVGAAFESDDSEGDFAEWLHSGKETGLEIRGITARRDREGTINDILSVQRSSSWLKHLEPLAHKEPLFDTNNYRSAQWVPCQLRKFLPENCENNLTRLSGIGIKVSQGLRTGCNGFFYAEKIERAGSNTLRILTSPLIGGDEIEIPTDSARSVLRRQSETQDYIRGQSLTGIVLDLREYVLPEDLKAVQEYQDLYDALGAKLPRAMPEPLAHMVRRAALTRYGTKGRKTIPELSAVKTNIRKNRTGKRPETPRFWYMLPDFKKRHLPDAFVPRINQDTPKVLPNRKPPILIDANFSTIWATKKTWTAEGIAGFLNSAWCQACMETTGTPMGGGALKLEATHLRRIPVPYLTSAEITQICCIAQDQSEIDRTIFRAILRGTEYSQGIEQIITELRRLTLQLKKDRQR